MTGTARRTPDQSREQHGHGRLHVPEQVRGKELDARTDLFSFGAVLYEMATGTLPFRGESLGVIFEAILNRGSRPAAAAESRFARRSWNEIINKALEKDRNLRYQHAAEYSRRPATAEARSRVRHNSCHTSIARENVQTPHAPDCTRRLPHPHPRTGSRWGLVPAIPQSSPN